MTVFLTGNIFCNFYLQYQVDDPLGQPQMSSPPPWVQDGRFNLTSPTNSLETAAQSPSPSLDNTRSAFSPVEGSSNRAQVFPLAERQATHFHDASQPSGNNVSDKTSMVKNQGQVKQRSPHDHWLILPPEFDSTQVSTTSKGQGQIASRSDGRQSAESQRTKMETEFPIDSVSPKVKHVPVTNVPSSSSTKVCDSSKEDKNNSNLSVEKFTKDLKEKESLKVDVAPKSDDVSPGQELLKLVDSFTEKYVIDKNDGLPHIKPQVAPSGGQSQSSHQEMALLESDSEDSEDSSHPLSHDFSCASTVSLNELLEKELDEMETPGDEDFSVNNLPIYMVENISIDDFEGFTDISHPKQIYDQCLVERKFEIKDGVLVARSTPREETLAKKQSNNNTSLENHNDTETPSPERPTSLKLGQSNSKYVSCESIDCENDKVTGVDRKGANDDRSANHSSKKGSPPKVLPKPNAKCLLLSAVEKCKSSIIPKGTTSGDVTPVMVVSNHSNSSSSPDSAMQGSFTSTSSSDVCGVAEKTVSRGDDGYVSNSTVSTSLNDLHKDLSVEGKFSRTPSMETRSTMSTPHSEVTSVVSRSDLNRERTESQCSIASQSIVESNSVGKVKDMKAYFEQRVEEITQEVTNAAKAAAAAANTVDSSITREVPNYIKIEPKMCDSNESATMMFSSCDSESMSSSFIVTKTGGSSQGSSSDMSNSQKTLTPQDPDAKTPPLSPPTCHVSSSAVPKSKPSRQSVTSRDDDDDTVLLNNMKPRTVRAIKHSLSDSNISQGRLTDCPGYLKSLHAQLARVYCLAESLKVSVYHVYSSTKGAFTRNEIQPVTESWTDIM